MRKNKPASHSSEKPVLGARNRGILEPFAGGNSAFVGNAVFFCRIQSTFLLRQKNLFCTFAESNICMSHKEALQLFGDKK